MLPFYLRHHQQKVRRKAEIERCQDEQNVHNNTEDGGPVQGAITKDLVNLRIKFRKELLDYTRGTEIPQTHWKTGTVFSIFKDAFGSSKIGMLHLLSPSRSDREAYSQLIYAVCLALFKESFEKMQRKTDGSYREPIENDDEIDHYNDAGFAIFSLLALFETNPLPRQIGIENPLELLPISLRSSEDTRSSYRRCFSKRIRVDRQHFALMLRLRDLSLVEKSNGERMHYDHQMVHIRDSISGRRRNLDKKIHQELSSNCRYGMSTDIIEALKRIFSRIELCEYTGPFGAEAFAGHAEYPYNKPMSCHNNRCQDTQMNRQLMHAENILQNERYRLESSKEHSNQVIRLLRKYKKSVARITIPTSKSNPEQRLQNLLHPLLIQCNKMRSGDFGEGPDQLSKEDLVSTRLSTNASNCEIILNMACDSDLEEALYASIESLLSRDKCFSKFSPDRDDVSSIGHGGISIGINKNRPTTLHIRSNVEEKRKKSDRLITEWNLASAFLTSKQSIGSVGSSEEDSVRSEMTMVSFSDSEGDEEDELSIATSAFGKKALNDLLQNVSQEEHDDIGSDAVESGQKKQRAKLKNHSQHKNGNYDVNAYSIKSNEFYNNEDESVATSAFGKRALQDLLKNIDGDSSKNRKKQNQKLKPKTMNKNTRQKTDTKTSSLDKKEDEEISIATSAYGKKALQDLLKNFDCDSVKERNRKEQKLKPNIMKKKKEEITDSRTPSLDKKEDDEISVATSAFGKRALEDLLKNVDRDNLKERNRKEQKLKPNTMNKKKKEKTYITTPSLDRKEDEEISVATSAFGKRALEDLLKNVDGDSLKKRMRKNQKLKPNIMKKKKEEITDFKTPSLDEKEDEETSVATSAFGKRALDDLLERIE